MLGLERLVCEVGGFRVAADFTVPAGARVAVIGPSGAGKSTLLAAIAGFEPLRQGRVLWDGRDIGGLAPGERPVAIVFQDHNLFSHLTAAENVGLGLRPSLRLAPAERDTAEAALARVGLAGLGERRPAELSGGQQSRVTLARVLVQRRPLMLLDEPFAALGPALKEEMLDLVAELAAETGATLLMVTHEPGDARRVCQDAILVVEGQAAPPRPLEELFENPPAALRDYLRARP